MLNIHPSLLPKYTGLHTHRRVLEAGDSEHGASVHFVTAELDGGPVVLQSRVPVLPGDTEADAVSPRSGHRAHHLPAGDRDGGGRAPHVGRGRVRLDGRLLDTPLVENFSARRRRRIASTVLLAATLVVALCARWLARRVAVADR